MKEFSRQAHVTVVEVQFTTAPNNNLGRLLAEIGDMAPKGRSGLARQGRNTPIGFRNGCGGRDERRERRPSVEIPGRQINRHFGFWPI